MRHGCASLAVLCALAACTDTAPTTAMFAVPGVSGGDEFYELPFPNDLRRHADGSIDLSLFPTNSLVVDAFRAAADGLDGFGLNAAIYARFDGELDPTSLPDAAGSLTEDASVYLVDIDPRSPARGERSPILVRFRAEPTQTLAGDHLIARPYPGFPLAEGTTYALVVTRRVRGADGGPAVAAADLRAVLSASPPAELVPARDVYQPLLDLLDEPGGDERADVVSAAVFTTQHATRISAALRAAVFQGPAPVAADVAASTVNAVYSVFIGTYQAPNFQRGDPPYRNAPDGRVEVGPDGVAIVQRSEAMRFAVTVPAGPVPATGWPFTIYQHGTTGDWRSFIVDGTADLLAREGIAVISTDQVLHGPRSTGGNPQYDFFNFGNPHAARDNAVQGFADGFSQLRLALGMTINDGDGRIHVFDAARVSFFGHSQGGTTGPGFVAFEPSLTGAVLSGTAGVLYLNMLLKTEPYDIPELVRTFARDEPIDADNPSLALLQMWIERADSVNYAPLMIRRPPLDAQGAPLAPRNIFQTEGFTDTYAPNLGIEAFATALGGDVVRLRDTQPIDGLALRGREVRDAPITNNLGGKTCVLGQYNQRPGSDGHFVVFDIPAARQQAGAFLGTLARTGQATVVAVP